MSAAGSKPWPRCPRCPPSSVQGSQGVPKPFSHGRDSVCHSLSQNDLGKSLRTIHSHPCGYLPRNQVAPSPAQDVPNPFSHSREGVCYLLWIGKILKHHPVSTSWIFFESRLLQGVPKPCSRYPQPLFPWQGWCLSPVITERVGKVLKHHSLPSLWDFSMSPASSRCSPSPVQGVPGALIPVQGAPIPVSGARWVPKPCPRCPRCPQPFSRGRAGVYPAASCPWCTRWQNHLHSGSSCLARGF